MIGTVNSPLGKGVYRLSEVARYTGLKQPRVRSWFLSRSDRRVGPVFGSDFGKIDGVHLVSFLDMVDAWIAGQLRAQGVSMRTIRAAHTILKKQLRTLHPFGHRAVYTDGTRILTDAAGRIGDPMLTEVISRQGFFPGVRERLTRIEYAPDTHLAQRWAIGTGVVIDPRIGFGKPVVCGTGLATHVLAQAYWANSSNAELAADLFGVTPVDVENAVGFEARYGDRRAA